MPRQRPLLKISISGPDVKPGRISIPILLKVCQEAQAAVIRQAEVIEGKKSDKPAPNTLLRECTLDLIGLKRGSTTLEFAPASKQMTFHPELASAGIEAVSAVATTLRDVNKRRGKWTPPDPRLLDALDNLGTELFDSGVDKLKWIAPRQNGHKGATAEFVPSTLKKVKQRKQEFLNLGVEPTATPEAKIVEGVPATTPQPQAVQGSFLEGLLEPAEGKVRITPAVGPPATISYSADKADTVLDAVHRPVRVRLDPTARKIVDIEVTGPEILDARLFFGSKSIDELVSEQGIHAVADVSALAGSVSDEEMDELVEEIYHDRRRQG